MIRWNSTRQNPAMLEEISSEAKVWMEKRCRCLTNFLRDNL
jgi:hypothetical protein